MAHRTPGPAARLIDTLTETAAQLLYAPVELLHITPQDDPTPTTHHTEEPPDADTAA